MLTSCINGNFTKTLWRMLSVTVSMTTEQYRVESSVESYSVDLSLRSLLALSLLFVVSFLFHIDSSLSFSLEFNDELNAKQSRIHAHNYYPFPSAISTLSQSSSSLPTSKCSQILISFVAFMPNFFYPNLIYYRVQV